jgi:membrane protein required for colicin V production
MAPLDWLIAAVLALSLALGALRGLVHEVISVAGWVAAFVVAQWFATRVGDWLPMGQASGMLRHVAGFAVVFVATVFAAGVLAWLVRKVIEAVGLRPVDRILGAAFGLVRGVVIVLAAAVVALMTPLQDTQAWTQSTGAALATATLRHLKPILPEPFGQYLPG